MRIAFVLTSLGPGGAQRQMIVTAHGLLERGHDVRILTLRGEAVLDEKVRALGISVEHLGGAGAFGGIVGRLRYLYRVRSFEPDVVYSFLPAANMTTAVARRLWHRAPLIWGIRDSGMNPAGSGAKARLVNQVADRSASVPDLIVANSEAARRHYTARGYPPDRFIVIPNGIDTEMFDVKPELRATERSRRGFEADNFVVACVGRIDPLKGHDDLLEAFAAVAQTRSKMMLWIVGVHSEEWRSQFLHAAELAGVGGSVRVSQAVDEPVAAYNAADLVVSASRFGEGFSNVLGEALACGCRVVATDVGDSALIVSTSGDVVQPGDVPDLASAIERAATVEAGVRLAQQRREHIVRNFSVSRLLDRTEEALAVAAERAAARAAS